MKRGVDLESAVAEAKRKVEALRRKLDEKMSGRVVSLAQVRELRYQLTMAGHQEYLAEMWVEYRGLVGMLFLMHARTLLDWVLHCCEQEGVSSETSASASASASAKASAKAKAATSGAVASVAGVEALARVVDELRTSSVFRRMDTQARRFYCEANGLPFVGVQAHTRAGLPVRGYERYVGTPHYDALPVHEYPPAVGQIVKLMQKAERRVT